MSFVVMVIFLECYGSLSYRRYMLDDETQLDIGLIHTHLNTDILIGVVLTLLCLASVKGLNPRLNPISLSECLILASPSW